MLVGLWFWVSGLYILQLVQLVKPIHVQIISNDKEKKYYFTVLTDWFMFSRKVEAFSDLNFFVTYLMAEVFYLSLALKPGWLSWIKELVWLKMVQGSNHHVKATNSP